MEIEGYVEKIEENIAYITLKTPSGEEFFCEYNANELKSLGIQERRKFKCFISDYLRFEPIPDSVITKARYREIDTLIESLGDDPQDDY